MPTYTDPSTGKRIRSDQPLDDHELEEAFGSGGGDQSTWYQRAGSYVGGKVMDWTNAGQNLIADVEQAATGKKMFPGERTGWQRAGDIATVAGPVIAPEMTLAGTAAGAGTRALGGGEDLADIADVGMQLATGGVQAARSVAGAGKRIEGGFKAVKEAMGAKGAGIAAGSAEGDALRTALENSLQRFNPDAGEKTAAMNVISRLRSLKLRGGISVGPGITYKELDDALTNIGDKPSEIGGIIRKARDALTGAKTPATGIVRGAVGAVTGTTPEARQLGRAYLSSGLQNRPIPFAKALKWIAGGGGGLRAYDLFKKGDYEGAVKAAGMGALAATGAGGSVGQFLAASGPLARTAAGLSGPAMRSLDEGGQGEQASPVPDITPSRPEPVSPTPDVAAAPSGRRTAAAPRGPFGREINAVASVVGVPAPLLHSFIDLESQYNPNAKGTSGEIGLMQITPNTWKQVEGHASQLLGRDANIANPLDNITGGALLLKQYLEHTDGDVGTTARMYNGGPGAEHHPVPHTVWYQGEIEKRFAKLADQATE